MSSKSCPISLQSIDANIVRINSIYVGILFSLFIFTQNSPLIYFLVIDFTTRVFFKKEYSLLFMLAKTTAKLLKIERNFVDSAPKRLASFFGFTFVLLIAASHTLDLTILFYILSAVLELCIILEVLFSYCLGCEIYHLYKKVFV